MFYPFAFSGLCTGELCGLRDDLGAFQNDSVQLVAISCDPMYSLKAFAEQEGYKFPLLADFWPHGAVAKAYGVFNEDRGCSIRGTFVIDKSGNSSYFEDRFGSVGVNLVRDDYEMQREIMISVLVVNLNNLQFTKDCIQDLFDQDVSCLITLVDQASVEEGTKEYLDEIGIKGVTVVRNTANEPLNHIWNWFAKTSETPYVCLLNNDVRLSPNFLSSAIEVFEREPQVGFVNHATNSKEYRAILL
jgi:cellulose synthase/poly-beta-1,6-N-acetylglucosamine synthase-like glycosyltransferase